VGINTFVGVIDGVGIGNFVGTGTGTLVGTGMGTCVTESAVPARRNAQIATRRPSRGGANAGLMWHGATALLATASPLPSIIIKLLQVCSLLIALLPRVITILLCILK